MQEFVHKKKAGKQSNATLISPQTLATTTNETQNLLSVFPQTEMSTSLNGNLPQQISNAPSIILNKKCKYLSK